MAHVWIREQVGGEWAVGSLGDAAVSLCSSGRTDTGRPAGGAAGELTLALAENQGEGEPVATLIPVADGWAVIARAAGDGLRLNGWPLAVGLRVLRDKDELVVAGHSPVFYSDEALPLVEPYPGDDDPRCPRCRLAIHKGDSAKGDGAKGDGAKGDSAKGDGAVRCGCGIWYHQTDEYPCFDYGESCLTCGRSTSLGSGFSWSPEEL